MASVIKYHKTINEDPSVPLPQVVLDLVEGTDGQIKSLMQVFARYKGTFPIGSFIRVDDEVVLVVGQSAVELVLKTNGCSIVRKTNLGGTRFVDCTLENDSIVAIVVWIRTSFGRFRIGVDRE